MADPTRMEQVFWNLLKNAYNSRPKMVRSWSVPSMGRGARVIFEISDSGRGIRRGADAEIVYRFEQGTRSGEGLGLGLAIWQEAGS